MLFLFLLLKVQSLLRLFRLLTVLFPHPGFKTLIPLSVSNLTHFSRLITYLEILE